MSRDEPYMVSEDGLPVKLISGAEFKVLTSDEVKYMKDRIQLYTSEYNYTNVSDLQEVDRILILELLVHRYGLFLSREFDYMDERIDENALRRSLGDFSSELRQIKKSLGMDKVSREKEKGEDSVSVYLENLRQRAKEFGIARNEEAEAARTLAHKLIALYELWSNCTDDEMIEQACRPVDIVEWIGSEFKPKFEEIDADLRKNQKMWVVKL